jgi:hypothetical protein
MVHDDAACPPPVPLELSAGRPAAPRADPALGRPA